MNCVDNRYLLKNVEVSNNSIRVYIELEADEETKTVYLYNYFEGLYIGENSSKYNIFANIENEIIIGEILFETVEGFSKRTSGNKLRLWIRNRIGNVYIDDAVYIGINEQKLSFGYREQYIFYKNDDLTFSFINYWNNCVQKNPLFPQKINTNVHIEKERVVIRVKLDENEPKCDNEIGISNELILAWKGQNSKKISYLNIAQKNKDNIFEFLLDKYELSKISIFEVNMISLDWLVIDSLGTEYKLYVDEDSCIKNSVLPIIDCYAKLDIAEDGHLITRLSSAFLFEYLGEGYKGNGFIIRIKKKNYKFELKRVIAQRVNTEIQYELPIENIERNDEYIYYGIKLEFDVCPIDFKNGIHQIWIEVKDGVSEELYPLKLIRCNSIRENTYLINSHPYALVRGHGYNCLFYNDNSNNLKINIVPKFLKVLIGNSKIENDILKIETVIKKEPYFMTIENIALLCENGELLYLGYNVVNENGNNLELEINIPIMAIRDYGDDAIFDFQIKFKDVKGVINIQNNYYRPSINNRETSSFSYCLKIIEKGYNRVWGNYRDGSYKIGITENLSLFNEIGIWIYEKKNLCIRIDWCSNIERQDNINIELYLKNMITSKEIAFERESNIIDEIIYKLPLNNILCGEYLVIAKLPNNKISYLKMTSSVTKLYVNEYAKTLSVIKNKDKTLIFNVDNMLLYEDTEKIIKCSKIIDSVKEEKNRKIWLIGENYGLSARDNGLAFFEFCMSNKVDAEVYFVYKEENKDKENLEKYKDNLIIYDSEKHILLDQIAEFYIVSHGIRDVMPSLYHNKLGIYRKNVIYLQHGVIAMKQVEISNKSYGGSIRKFVVSSKQERDFLINNKQFWDDELIITGLSRYDNLSKNKYNGNYIWVMPTWRDWLVNSERDFVNSNFYKYYSAVLSNVELIDYLRKCNKRIVFNLHIEFEKYKDYFIKFENDVIHITDMHKKSISERVQECSMIVTDYSSIAFDVVYLNKPVVFFQFDQEEYNRKRGSYVDLNTDLPGEVVYQPQKLIKSLIQMILSDFTVKKEYVEKRKKYFDYNDCENSCRIYEQIIKCREEIADEN